MCHFQLRQQDLDRRRRQEEEEKIQRMKDEQREKVTFPVFICRKASAIFDKRQTPQRGMFFPSELNYNNYYVSIAHQLPVYFRDFRKKTDFFVLRCERRRRENNLSSNAFKQ